MKIVIYWKTKDTAIIKRIRERFNLSSYMSVNGETPCEISEEDIEVLKKCGKYIQIRYKELKKDQYGKQIT